MLNSVAPALSQWPASVWQWKACLRSCHRSPGVRLMSCPACMESLREQRFYHAGGWHLFLHQSTFHPHEDDTLCVFLWWRWMLKSQLILFGLAHSRVLNSVLFLSLCHAVKTSWHTKAKNPSKMSLSPEHLFQNNHISVDSWGCCAFELRWQNDCLWSQAQGRVSIKDASRSV